MRTKYLAALLVLGLLQPILAAAAPDILRYEHENLASGQQEALDALRSEATFLFFFQPDCKWCLKQSKTLDRLLAACEGKVSAAALGVHATRHELKKELRRLRPDYPAYKTGERMLEDLAGVPATPIMLMADASGAFVQSFRGYVPDQDLGSVLTQQYGVDCAL